MNNNINGLIGIFNSRATKTDVINRNGEFILNGVCSSATITEELNGNFNFDFTLEIIPTFNNELYSLVENESIVKVLDENNLYQVFRITKVQKEIDCIMVNCRHICLQDLFTYYLEDVRPTEKTGQQAMNELDKLSKANRKEITFTSDIQKVSTSYFVNKNMYQALFDSENSFVSRWGGELKCNMYTLAVNSRIGVDKGTTIRNKKNLTKFEVYSDIDNLVTRIYPIGFDGITINEKFIDSPKIKDYARIYSKKVKFDDVKVKKPVEEGQPPSEEDNEGFDTLEQAQAELKRRVALMYEVDKVDQLIEKYRIDFVELSRTEEYKHFKVLETVNIGDTINIIDDKTNTNIIARVTKRQYDVIKRERKSTELSNLKSEPKQVTNNQLSNKIDSLPSTSDILSQANSYANTILAQGIPNSSVISRRDELLILIDSKDPNKAQKLFKFNSDGLQYSSSGYNGEYKTLINNLGEFEGIATPPTPPVEPPSRIDPPSNGIDIYDCVYVPYDGGSANFTYPFPISDPYNIIALCSHTKGAKIKIMKTGTYINFESEKKGEVNFHLHIKNPK